MQVKKHEGWEKLKWMFWWRPDKFWGMWKKPFQVNGSQASYVSMCSVTQSRLPWKVSAQQQLQCSLDSSMQHEAVSRVQGIFGLNKFPPRQYLCPTRCSNVEDSHMTESSGTATFLLPSASGYSADLAPLQQLLMLLIIHWLLHSLTDVVSATSPWVIKGKEHVYLLPNILKKSHISQPWGCRKRWHCLDKSSSKNMMNLWVDVCCSVFPVDKEHGTWEKA